MYYLRSAAPRLQLSKQLLRQASTKTTPLTRINSSLPPRIYLSPRTTTCTIKPPPFPTITQPHRLISTSATLTMSNPGSNTTSSGAPAVDPYKAKNTEEDVSLEEKIEALVKFAQANKFGMMTTRDAETEMLVSRCMAIAAAENGGIDLLFHTNTHSGKTHDLATDAHINIAFLNASNEWASISGLASIITERELVRKYYSPQLKAWVGDLGDGVHDGGPEDPRIGVIRVRMLTATYALVSKGPVGRTKEVVKGMVTGETASTNKLREISTEEVQRWRQAREMVQ